jgi:hypothetical protein
MTVLGLVMPVNSNYQFTAAYGAIAAIAPEVCVEHRYNKYLKRMYYVTGKFIDTIQQTRKF